MRRRGRTGRCDPVRFGDAGNFSYIRFDVSFKTGRSDDGSGPSSDRRSVRSVPEGADPLPKRTIAATRVMKKRMLLLAACVAAVGCTTPELEHLPPKGPEAESLLTLAEARAWYDSGASVATRGETECRPADLFRTGPLRPDWSRGVLSADRRLSAVDVPAAGRYAYGVVYDSLVVPIHTGLLVLKEADDGTMCDYTAFYIPDRACAADYTAEVCSYFRNRERKLLFSGLALYALPSGMPVAAERYREGEPVEACFLPDTLRSTVEENWTQLRSMLEEFCLLRYERVATRTDEGDIGFCIDDGKPAVCIGRLPYKYPGLGDPDHPINRKPTNPNLTSSFGNHGNENGGGGPGDGNGPSSDDKGYPANDLLRYDDPRIEAMLDSLLHDCLGNALIESIGGTIDISTNDRGVSHYNPVSRTIEIGHDRTTVLLEELFHSYQYQTGDYAIHPKLNYEIEAKLGWSLYVVRNGGDLANYGKYLGQYQGYMMFQYMVDIYSDYHMRGGNYDPSFENWYYSASDLFRNSGSDYADPQKYPFTYEWNLDNLDELMKDC